MLAMLVEIFLSSIHSSLALFFVPIHAVSFIITRLCSGASEVSKEQFFVELIEVVGVLLAFSASVVPWPLLSPDKLKYTPPPIIASREMPMRIERLMNMLVRGFKVCKAYASNIKGQL